MLATVGIPIHIRKYRREIHRAGAAGLGVPTKTVHRHFTRRWHFGCDAGDATLFGTHLVDGVDMPAESFSGEGFRGRIVLRLGESLRHARQVGAIVTAITGSADAHAVGRGVVFDAVLHRRLHHRRDHRVYGHAAGQGH